MSKENLSEILEKLQSDDQAVLKTLFQEHYLSVCKSIYRFVKDKSTTEDIAQDVFIKFWEKRKKLNKPPLLLHICIEWVQMRLFPIYEDKNILNPKRLLNILFPIT